jgi:hypothetical protein
MLNNQLTKVYYAEALQEAAQSRAERGPSAGHTRNNFIGFFIIVLALTPVVVWLFQTFSAG